MKHVSAFSSALLFAAASPVFTACSHVEHSMSGNNEVASKHQLEAANVYRRTKLVADWMLANKDSDAFSPDFGWGAENELVYSHNSWVQGAMYVGMGEWAEVSGSPSYYEFLRSRGESTAWTFGDRIYHADEHVVGDMYLRLYRKYNDGQMIGPLKQRFDYIMDHPSRVSLSTDAETAGVESCNERWCWSDAVFMSPPIWAQLAAETGDQRYLNFMTGELTATIDYLFDRDESLFLRDDNYLDDREPNGEKVFWSRGNGWAYAGLARVIEYMPANHESRPYFEEVFRLMSDRLVAIQPDDGYWRSSLLDPASVPNPETSGTAFFAYGLAWGLNNGVLNGEKYDAAVMSAWGALDRAIHDDGKVGWVQQIGEDPQSTNFETTELFAVGGVLMAGSELYKLLRNKETNKVD